MAADTLTPHGAVTITAAPDQKGDASVFLGYAAIPGADEIVALSVSGYSPQYQGAIKITAAGYTLSGATLFNTVVWDNTANFPAGAYAPKMALLANGDVVVSFDNNDGLSMAGDEKNQYAVISPTGQTVTTAMVRADGGSDQYGPYSYSVQSPAAVYATATGFTMELTEVSSWARGPVDYAYAVHPFNLLGQAGQGVVTPETGNDLHATAHAFAAGAAATSASLQVADNTVQYFDGATLHGAVAIPGEPAGAITDEAAAMLANGQAAVAWVDSGTDYVSIFDPTTGSFGARIGLDWGGASDIHALALPDGGFAVSWMNGGGYKGEVFDSAGNGGGIIALAGDVAGIDSQGNLYTVAQDSSGHEVIQTYAIASGGQGGSGQAFTSDNAGDTWVGTAGNDVFHLGRGGDTVTGNGGDDTFQFAEIPWAGGHITDFNAGDTLDLTGLMSTTGDTRSDGFSDGYLKIGSDSSGNAQVWAQYATSGSSSGWWLVETLDGVSASSLATNGDVVSISPGGAVSSSAANYVAPANVTAITLTGSQQHVDASAINGVAITSNNSGNTLIGGSGDDVFHIGRGGDTVTGGPGADTFAFAETPWAGGQITDFNGAQGDVIDVRGMLQASGYLGADPFTDGYLRITDSAQGAQMWSDTNQPGNSGWWLVGTIDGVSTSSLHYAGGLIT